jgi:hypothetical protein
LEQHREVADLTAEAHDVEHDRRPVVRRVVGDLHGAYLLDALAGTGQCEGQIGREPGIDTRHEDRITLLRSIFDAFDVLVRNQVPRVLHHPQSRADDVDAGHEDLANVGHGLGQPGVAHRAVHDAVGVGCDDRMEVVGSRQHPWSRRTLPAHRRPCRPRRPTTPTHACRVERTSYTSCVSARLPQLPVPMSATRMAMLVPLRKTGTGSTCGTRAR